MSEEHSGLIFEMDLGDRGERLRFCSSQELQTWNSQEFAKWQWLGDSSMSQLYGIREQHHKFRDQINHFVDQWNNVQKDPHQVQSVFNSLKNVLQQFYRDKLIFNSTAPEAIFLFGLLETRGNDVAAGAYAALLDRELQDRQAIRPKLIEGMVEGFLYKREIDWTATAHQEALNSLKDQYAGNIARQDTRFKEIDQQNMALNESFQTALNEKKSALDELHEGQVAEFKRLTEEHEANLKAIELAYDQKLALHKPIEYWETRETDHKTHSRQFGIASLLVGVGLACLLGWLAHWVFGNLPQGENPKHWQMGVILVAAFFAIWIMRILVRLFFSHLHLAEDAAERKTMIRTYLSMAREGSQFAPEDKTLIVQHLFRSVSDGLVKDDAAPPSILELLSRK